MQEIESHGDEPVSIIVSRAVKRGCEAQFEAWAKEFTRQALTFPGHLGASIIRPSDHVHPEYVIIFRFANYTYLKAWEDSDVRQEWLEKVHPILEREARIEHETGLEFWFTPPDVTIIDSPPRYKQVLVTWLAIVPLSLILGRLLQPVVMPMLVREIIMPAILITLMTYLVMPRLTNLLAFWLFKK